ncbi:MAG TPA: hypothetical protein VJR92_13790 [Gemmatimonadaceae bacterium]|nr:hypothetical protein [Gemmatimonadaceae bacterium]
MNYLLREFPALVIPVLFAGAFLSIPAAIGILNWYLRRRAYRKDPYKAAHDDVREWIAMDTRAGGHETRRFAESVRYANQKDEKPDR